MGLRGSRRGVALLSWRRAGLCWCFIVILLADGSTRVGYSVPGTTLPGVWQCIIPDYSRYAY